VNREYGKWFAAELRKAREAHFQMEMAQRRRYCKHGQVCEAECHDCKPPVPPKPEPPTPPHVEYTNVCACGRMVLTGDNIDLQSCFACRGLPETSDPWGLYEC